MSVLRWTYLITGFGKPKRIIQPIWSWQRFFSSVSYITLNGHWLFCYLLVFVSVKSSKLHFIGCSLYFPYETLKFLHCTVLKFVFLCRCNYFVLFCIHSSLLCVIKKICNGYFLYQCSNRSSIYIQNLNEYLRHKQKQLVSLLSIIRTSHTHTHWTDDLLYL